MKKLSALLWVFATAILLVGCAYPEDEKGQRSRLMSTN